MGKDFIPVKANHLNLKEVYDKLTLGIGTNKITEASNKQLFYKFPEFNQVEDIQIGDKVQGTNESVIWLKNGNHLVVDKTIDYPFRRLFSSEKAPCEKVGGKINDYGFCEVEK